jgi:hypothetical protein
LHCQTCSKQIENPSGLSFKGKNTERACYDFFCNLLSYRNMGGGLDECKPFGQPLATLCGAFYNGFHLFLFVTDLFMAAKIMRLFE